MLRVTLLSPVWRLVTATLVATSLLTLPTYLLALYLLPPVPPIVMVRSFVVGTALPFLVAWAILRTFDGTAEVANGVLVLRRGDLEVEAPAQTIAARPWWLPLPDAGLSLRLQSGGRVPFGVAVRDPGPLLAMLETGGADAAAARRHPGVVHAATTGPRSPLGWLLKFVVFGAAPAAVLLYTHQHIAYGGTFGQYYLEGPAAYFSTLFQYWATTVIYLVSYASYLRAVAEVVVWTAGALRPGWATGARRVVEVACGLAYWGGVPVLLALRYLA